MEYLEDLSVNDLKNAGFTIRETESDGGRYRGTMIFCSVELLHKEMGWKKEKLLFSFLKQGTDVTPISLTHSWTQWNKGNRCWEYVGSMKIKFDPLSHNTLENLYRVMRENSATEEFIRQVKIMLEKN